MRWRVRWNVDPRWRRGDGTRGTGGLDWIPPAAAALPTPPFLLCRPCAASEHQATTKSRGACGARHGGAGHARLGVGVGGARAGCEGGWRVGLGVGVRGRLVWSITLGDE
jgi:hypothetical protein